MDEGERRDGVQSTMSREWTRKELAAITHHDGKKGVSRVFLFTGQVGAIEVGSERVQTSDNAWTAGVLMVYSTVPRVTLTITPRLYTREWLSVTEWTDTMVRELAPQTLQITGGARAFEIPTSIMGAVTRGMHYIGFGIASSVRTELAVEFITWID